MRVKRTLSALALTAMLGAPPAWAALPAPSPQASLLYLDTTQNAVFFMVLPAPQRTGETVDVWYFAALTVPRTISGATATGTWVHGRMDCTARTFRMDDFIIVGTDHSTIWRDSSEVAPDPVLASSPNDIAMAMLCDGKPPASPRTVEGIDGALRMTRSTPA